MTPSYDVRACSQEHAHRPHVFRWDIALYSCPGVLLRTPTPTLSSTVPARRFENKHNGVTVTHTGAVVVIKHSTGHQEVCLYFGAEGGLDPEYDQEEHELGVLIQQYGLTSVHQFNSDTDRCICGGEWVYQEDTTPHGHACEHDTPCVKGCGGTAWTKHTKECAP